MATELPEAEDTELNMTPMIDIVFQLIIFFLLTLKFKTIDRRIESMLPKDRGLAPTPTFPEDFLKVKIKLFRRDLGNKEKEHTVIRVDNDRTIYKLPSAWQGRHKESEERRDEYDKTMKAIAQNVKRKLQAHGGNPEDVKGEIVAPPPKGGAVPHGDIMQVLDIFLKLKMTDVVFEGTPAPLTKKEAAKLGAGS